MAKKKKESRNQKRKREQQAKARQRQAAPQSAGAAASAPQNPAQSGAFRRAMRKEKAAQLIAKGDLAIEDVAVAVGVNRDTLCEWHKEPEFVARIAQLQQRIKDKLETLLISQKFYRQLCLQEQLFSLQTIRDARAAKLNVPADQGGESGYMVRKLRMIGSGENAREVEEFVVDTAFAKEYRDTLRHAAEEAGQLVTKVAPTTPDGKDEYSGVPAIDLEQFRQLPVEDRIRLLRAPIRVPPPHREEPPTEA